MSQFSTSASGRGDRREVPGVPVTTDTGDPASPQPPRRPPRPRFVFSPALVEYFSELHGQQARINKRQDLT